MATIVENWGLVEGRVEQWQRGGADTPSMLTLTVERVSAVERSPGAAYPNFVEGREGMTIRVRVPDDAARRLEVAPGQRVRVRVRRGRGADEFFAHPDEITVVR